MTIKECYEALKGNYEDAKSRLMTEKLMERIMLKFPADETMSLLLTSLAEKDYDEAFRFAHTLKGVAANLGFEALRSSSSELTELLRNDRTEPDPAFVEKVREDYNLVIDVLRKYQDEQ